jgi:hypothetical protein
MRRAGSIRGIAAPLTTVMCETVELVTYNIEWIRPWELSACDLEAKKPRFIAFLFLGWGEWLVNALIILEAAAKLTWFFVNVYYRCSVVARCGHIMLVNE